MKVNVFIYIMECQGFLKIGITESLKRRICHIRSGNPFDVRLAYKHKINSRHVALFVEKSTHKKLKSLGLHHRREWFSGLSVDDAIKVISESMGDAEHMIAIDRMITAQREADFQLTATVSPISYLPICSPPAYVPLEWADISRRLYDYKAKIVSDKTGVSVAAIRKAVDGFYGSLSEDERTRLSIFFKPKEKQ